MLVGVRDWDKEMSGGGSSRGEELCNSFKMDMGEGQMLQQVVSFKAWDKTGGFGF